MENIIEEKPSVVVIGGGTGLSVMLRGLKEQPIDLTAIVTVADDGGSSGRLRQDLDMPPPGDIRNVIVALADTEPLLSRLLQHRFSNGELAGHSLGNLIIAAMKEISGDFVHAVREISRVFAVKGKVLPAANQGIVLHARMTDGTLVSGESQIPRAGKKIKQVFLEPEDVQPLPEAIRAIEEADMILIGPGSLYTSILPNLLVPGIVDAIRRSAAVKAYICNVMTQPGETDGYSAADHIRALQEHVGNGLFRYVIVNDGEIPENVVQQYAQEGAAPVRFDKEKLEQMGYDLISGHLIQYETYLRHHTVRLTEMIMKLLQTAK